MCNDIQGNIEYDLINECSAAVVSDSIFWGSPTTSELDSHQENLTKIYDSQDNSGVGQVLIRSWHHLACGGECSDSDGDGYGKPADPSCGYPQLDCDDSNTDVNPGAIEGPGAGTTCGDGLDNDCDGLIDTNDPDCICIDNDGDGYGDPASSACTHPEEDCDDTNYAVNPGAIESPPGDPICSDTLDNDCDDLIDSADPDCKGGYSGAANAEASIYGPRSLTASGSFNALVLLAIPLGAVILLRILRRRK